MKSALTVNCCMPVPFRPLDDVGVDIYRNLSGNFARASAVSKRAVERIGEIGGGFVARSFDFVPVKFPKRTHGIDGIFRKGDKWIILEAKGGTGALSGRQMTKSWINDNMNRLPDNLRTELIKARDSGNLFGMVTSTAISETGEILDPSCVLKSFSDIGTKGF